MSDIELNIIKGNLGSNIFKYNKYYKLSNNKFLIRSNSDGGCLQLCEIKNLKFKCLSSSPKFMWTVLGILELKDKNIMVWGRKFIQVFKINNNKFELIKDDYKNEWGELLDIYQLENEKIIINSRLGFLLMIEKKERNYVRVIK